MHLRIHLLDREPVGQGSNNFRHQWTHWQLQFVFARTLYFYGTISTASSSWLVSSWTWCEWPPWWSIFNTECRVEHGSLDTNQPSMEKSGYCNPQTTFSRNFPVPPRLISGYWQSLRLGPCFWWMTRAMTMTCRSCDHAMMLAWSQVQVGNAGHLPHLLTLPDCTHCQNCWSKSCGRFGCTGRIGT